MLVSEEQFRQTAACTYCVSDYDRCRLKKANHIRQSSQKGILAVLRFLSSDSWHRQLRESLRGCDVIGQLFHYRVSNVGVCMRIEGIDMSEMKDGRTEYHPQTSYVAGDWHGSNPAESVVNQDEVTTLCSQQAIAHVVPIFWVSWIVLPLLGASKARAPFPQRLFADSARSRTSWPKNTAIRRERVS